MDENLMHELHTLRSQKEDVHNWLDNLGVPRKERGAILSPMGRLEWLYGHCPKAMQVLDSAVYATLKKEGLPVNDNESDTEGTEQMMEQRNTITVQDLNKNIDAWSHLKDTGRCRFVYQGDYVDGIGEFNGGYCIEYGGAANDPAIVNGDTVINIEWRVLQNGSDK